MNKSQINNNNKTNLTKLNEISLKQLKIKLFESLKFYILLGLFLKKCFITTNKTYKYKKCDFAENEAKNNLLFKRIKTKIENNNKLNYFIKLLKNVLNKIKQSIKAFKTIKKDFIINKAINDGIILIKSLNKKVKLLNEKFVSLKNKIKNKLIKKIYIFRTIIKLGPKKNESIHF